LVEEDIETLKRKLVEEGIEAEITGRPKHIYSIYRKMQRKGVPFSQVYDVRGIRVITQTVPDCYRILGVVHGLWKPIPGEFDDYIATPKDNMYQSLHTAVVGDDGKTLEVQIRTWEMHRIAEYGIAAHWRYKEGGKRDEVFEAKIAWLRSLMEWRQEVTDAGEFVDAMKTDVFQDRVYAFTPKGKIIDLPVGATPIDFAYYVHTEIGHRCRGAKVNDRWVGLDYQLRTGDRVEIITSKRAAPSRDWLNPALGASGNGTSEPRNGCQTFQLRETGRLPRCRRFWGHQQPANCRQNRRNALPRGGEAASHPSSSYITRGRGVTVHRRDCPNILRLRNTERLIEVSWGTRLQTVPVTIRITAYDRTRLLHEISGIISAENINMAAVNVGRRKNIVTLYITVEINDIAQLSRVLTKIERLPNVFEARRHMG